MKIERTTAAERDRIEPSLSLQVFVERNDFTVNLTERTNMTHSDVSFRWGAYIRGLLDVLDVDILGDTVIGTGRTEDEALASLAQLLSDRRLADVSAGEKSPRFFWSPTTLYHDANEFGSFGS